MDTLTVILLLAALLFGGAIVIGIILGARDHRIAKNIDSRIRGEPDFAPADVYVSDTSLTGIAIDRGRSEIILADKERLRRFGIGSIVGCEILQDEVQIARFNRGSQALGVAVGGTLLGGVGATIGGLSGSRRNIQKIVLRVTTDDFDQPHHDIVMLDWSFRKKGLQRDNFIYKNALDTAERWHGRLAAMMQAR